MDSASTRLELISETGSIADLDIRDVDPVSAAEAAPAQVTDVSVLGSVEVPPAIVAVQALTMDNVIHALLCTTYIMCTHALPLASTSNQLLLTSASIAAPFARCGA